MRAHLYFSSIQNRACRYRRTTFVHGGVLWMCWWEGWAPQDESQEAVLSEQADQRPCPMMPLCLLPLARVASSGRLTVACGLLWPLMASMSDQGDCAYVPMSHGPCHVHAGATPFSLLGFPPVIHCHTNPSRICVTVSAHHSFQSDN